MVSFFGGGKLSLAVECPGESKDQSLCWRGGFKCLSDSHVDSKLANGLVDPMTPARGHCHPRTAALNTLRYGFVP